MNHVTQAKVAMAALITAQLPAYLATADAENAATVATPVPAAVYRTNVTTLDAYPAVELIARTSLSQKDSTAQVYKHTVIVGFTLAGDDEQRLADQRETYMWALRQLFRDTQIVPPDGTSPIDTGTEEYTLVEERPTGLETPFIAGGWLETFVQTVE